MRGLNQQEPIEQPIQHTAQDGDPVSSPFDPHGTAAQYDRLSAGLIAKLEYAFSVVIGTLLLFGVITLGNWRTDSQANKLPLEPGRKRWAKAPSMLRPYKLTMHPF
jgi:hypothetical protein